MQPPNDALEKKSDDAEAPPKFADAPGDWERGVGRGIESCGPDCDVAPLTSQLRGSYRPPPTSAHSSGRETEPPQELDSDGAKASVTDGLISASRDEHGAPSETKKVATAAIHPDGGWAKRAAVALSSVMRTTDETEFDRAWSARASQISQKSAPRSSSDAGTWPHSSQGERVLRLIIGDFHRRAYG